MLDLTNITLGSFLLLNSQEGAEPEQITSVNDDTQHDNDNLIDPGAFVFLLAQVTPELSAATKTDSAKSEAEKLIESEATKSKRSIADEVVSGAALGTEVVGADFNGTLDDNVAVTWINSEYYQAELNSAPQAAEESTTLTATPDFLATSERSDILENKESSTQVMSNALDEEIPSLLAPALEQNKSAIVNATEQTHVSEALEFVQTEHYNQGEHDLVMTLPDAASEPFITPEHDVSIRVPSEALSLTSKIQSDSIENELDTDTIELDAFDVADLTQAKSGFLPEAHMQKLSVSAMKQPAIAEQFIPNQVQLDGLGSISVTSHKISEPVTTITPNSLSIPMELDDPQWSKQFSEHVIWLGQQGIKNATIKIHPEELGPLEISIKVLNDSASVNIMSHSPYVRDIIDQSVSRLHTMMAEQGLNLSEFNISSDEGTRQFEQPHHAYQEELAYLVDAEEEVVLAPVINKTTPQGVIDYFA